jgi:BRCT domain type II-containing protein
MILAAARPDGTIRNLAVHMNPASWAFAATLQECGISRDESKRACLVRSQSRQDGIAPRTNKSSTDRNPYIEPISICIDVSERSSGRMQTPIRAQQGASDSINKDQQFLSEKVGYFTDPAGRSWGDAVHPRLLDVVKK